MLRNAKGVVSTAGGSQGGLDFVNERVSSLEFI